MIAARQGINRRENTRRSHIILLDQLARIFLFSALIGEDAKRERLNVIRLKHQIIFDGERADHTLEEVGRDFDVTRERIRQIEAKALRKLRHPSRSKRLKSFVE